MPGTSEYEKLKTASARLQRQAYPSGRYCFCFNCVSKECSGSLPTGSQLASISVQLRCCFQYEILTSFENVKTNKQAVKH
jgi:hypothetical protein